MSISTSIYIYGKKSSGKIVSAHLDRKKSIYYKCIHVWACFSTYRHYLEGYVRNLYKINNLLMVSYGAYVLGGRMEALFLTLYISIEFDLKKQKP